MIFQVMALYDSKARCYRPPFFVGHVDVGFRAVQNAVNQAEHELAKYAEDFSLWHMGEFDDVSGNFCLKPQPMNLGCILQLKRQEHLPLTLAEQG